MKLYIPEIGDEFLLSKDWTFELFEESRNEKTIKRLVDPKYQYRWGRYSEDKSWMVTIPAGAQLKVDRIYIRKGISDYSSLSFYLTVMPEEKPKSTRFWAKLKDVNNIEFSEVRMTAKVPKIEVIVRKTEWRKSLFESFYYSPLNNYVNESDMSLPQIIVKVDNKEDEVIVTYSYELEKLSAREKKIANNNMLYNYLNPTHAISKFSVKAVHKPTGRVITEGRIATESGLTKKIKDFYKKELS